MSSLPCAPRHGVRAGEGFSLSTKLGLATFFVVLSVAFYVGGNLVVLWQGTGTVREALQAWMRRYNTQHPLRPSPGRRRPSTAPRSSASSPSRPEPVETPRSSHSNSAGPGVLTKGEHYSGTSRRPLPPARSRSSRGRHATGTPTAPAPTGRVRASTRPRRARPPVRRVTPRGKRFRPWRRRSRPSGRPAPSCPGCRFRPAPPTCPTLSSGRSARRRPRSVGRPSPSVSRRSPAR